MGFTRLWPMVFLIAIPCIILLYILKQKTREQEISAINLWKTAYMNVQASTPWEKFRNNILMYLQILLMILLILALMSPYIADRNSSGSNVLILIDNSASMGGIYSSETTKLEEAKSQSVDYVRKNNESKYTVISSAESAVSVISSSNDTASVIDAIENISQTDEAGSLDRGVAFAQSLAGLWKDYSCIAFTDSDVDLNNIEGDVVSLCTEGENAAISVLSHTEKEDGSISVMAYVNNYGGSSLSTEISLYIGEKIYDIQKVEISPEDGREIYFKDIPLSRYKAVLESDTPYLWAELSDRDMLENDNTAYDILQKKSDGKILLVTEQNSFLEKSLKLIKNTSVEKTNKADMEDTSEYSTIVYDGVLPDKLPENSNVIFVAPPLKESESEWYKDIFGDYKVAENTSISIKKSEVTEYISDYKFQCIRTDCYNTPSWAESLFKVNKEGYDGLSAGFYGSYKGRKAAVIGFDLHGTDFPLQTEFPIFMYSLLSGMSDSGVIDKYEYAVGENVIIQNNNDKDKIVVKNISENRHKEFADKASVSFTDTSYAGLYSIENGEQKTYFNVKFPEEESVINKDIKVSKSGDDSKQAGNKALRGISKKQFTRPILFVVLMVMLLEWRIYRKRL